MNKVLNPSVKYLRSRKMDHISKDRNITGYDLETDQEKYHKSHNQRVRIEQKSVR